MDYANCQTMDCSGGLTQMALNTKSYDLICVKCCERYQVKTLRQKSCDTLPKRILGAAWAPQKLLLESSGVPSIFLVLRAETGETSLFFISKESQVEECFIVRKPLSEKAKSPGWVGFYVEINRLSKTPTRVL